MPLCWLVVALSSRHVLNPDGVSYADIAYACMRGDWHALVNAYWSPGYPVLLIGWLSIFRPSRYWEITAIHLLSVVSLIGTLFSLEFFLRGVPELRSNDGSAGGDCVVLPVFAARAIIYTVFFWVTVYLTPASLDQPDILVFAMMLILGGITVRMIRHGRSDWGYYAIFGVVLGLSYLVKAVMLPMGLIFAGSVLLLAETIGARFRACC